MGLYQMHLHDARSLVNFLVGTSFGSANGPRCARSRGEHESNNEQKRQKYGSAHVFHRVVQSLKGDDDVHQYHK